MNEVVQEQQTPVSRLQKLAEATESGTLLQVRLMLNGLYPAEIAHLLEALTPDKRDFIWELVDPDLKGDVLLELNDDISDKLIEQMETDQIVALTEALDVDDMADFLQDLPDTVTDLVLQSLDDQERRRVEAILHYPEDTAGGLMNTDTMTVRPDVTVDVVLRYLRRKGEIPKMTDSLIVVTRNNKYLGLVPLTALLTHPAESTIGEIVSLDVEGIPADMKDTEVASLFEYRDLISAPVVDDQGYLLGRITVDDVVDVIRENADQNILSMAGLNDEHDMFAPVLISTRRRAIWLGINLFTAFIASWVIGLFDHTIEKLVALAVLMPIVASMGGIAGTQTLTLVIRGIAVGHIGETNARRLMYKELLVGVLNGILWALIVATITVLWFKNLQLGLIIGAAMIINLVTAAFTGATLPGLLRRMGIDPALAGGVVLTTVTDVIGFMAFLGLAAIYLV